MLDSNLLEEIPPEIGGATALTDLRLAKNRLTSLPDTIGNLSLLSTLDISGNQLAVLPRGIQECTKLAIFSAKDNFLTEIPDWVAALQCLRILSLQGNQITAVPLEVAFLSRLADLHVDNNPISFPPQNIFEAGLPAVQLYLGRLSESPTTRRVDLTKVPMKRFSCHDYLATLRLHTLVLNHNNLATLLPDVSRLTDLTCLDIAHNALASLPATLSELPALATLTADHNALEALPVSLGKCAALTALSVTHNQLTTLPPSLGNLSGLRQLSLAGNPFVSPPEIYVRKRSLPWLLKYLRAMHAAQENGGALQLLSMHLSDIPSDICSLSSVTRLTLNCNDLRDVPASILALSLLETLALANNKLMRLPPSVCALPVLSSLVLDDNLISDIPPQINQLSTLLSLSLAHNSLHQLPAKLPGQPPFVFSMRFPALTSCVSAPGLSELQMLCLDGNRLGELSPALLLLTNLRVLSLRDCGIHVIPNGVTVLRRLRQLNLSDNALEALPSLNGLIRIVLLRLSNNKMQQLPLSVLTLTDLEELSLVSSLLFPHSVWHFLFHSSCLFLLPLLCPVNLCRIGPAYSPSSFTGRESNPATSARVLAPNKAVDAAH